MDIQAKIAYDPSKRLEANKVYTFSEGEEFYRAVMTEGTIRWPVQVPKASFKALILTDVRVVSPT